jgi:hypothetical protein
VRTSRTLDELRQAGVIFGLSSFSGEGLGNLTLGKTTFSAFRVLVDGRGFREEDGRFIYEFPPEEFGRSELRRVTLRFTPDGEPPPEGAVLTELLLEVAKPMEEVGPLLARFGGDFDEVILPKALNRYGEPATSTYLSRTKPYAVDADRTGIRIFAALPKPGSGAD